MQDLLQLHIDIFYQLVHLGGQMLLLAALIMFSVSLAAVLIWSAVLTKPVRQLQQMVEETYGLFTQRVANGRKMTVAAVDSIGQGRVWSGKDAIGIGLVDELGSLDDAIAKAAKLANVSDYKVAYYPHQKSFFEMLFNKEDEADQMIHAKLGDLYYMYQGMQTVLHATGVQARMPMEIRIQ